MAEKLTRQNIAQVATLYDQLPLAPVAKGVCVDRSFELPAALYGATVGLFLAFIGVMGMGFANPQMALPLAIFALFIVAGFGVPAIWVRMRPEHPQRSLSWSRFRSQGIQTATGHCPASAAIMQVLILPALILLWGLTIVVIAALV